jgi:hypothetical protein
LIALLRTNDIVLISLVETLLTETGIPHFVADSHMSALEGSIGAFQRRLMVRADHLARARRVLIEAGLADQLPEAT